ncbi:uncharacterized protein BXZ73DRAFT_44818 [Epithele typhae]|uniref:uncharacterized protein n=1 Tax=Epithele typhae TaxID=378194 RepID=UPI002008E4E0|nr:uncharacterized protein BXZ73DRAFT_44818 [Epithele typhae]KAH9937858.1 hypothetical protein BXZ73DRAFT_44818 [Epithele typhae]
MAARRGRFRSKLCRNFALGHCPQGDACNYLHASPETIQSSSAPFGLQPSVRAAAKPRRIFASRCADAWPTLSPMTTASAEHQPAYSWAPPLPPPPPSSAGPSATHPQTRIKYRPLSWRTALCRHFVKNRGWCPIGEECNYIHDLDLAEFAKDDVRFADRRAGGAGQGVSQGQGGRGRGRAGSKHSHCWAYVQGLCHVNECQYMHPVAVELFAPHTPCLSWPNCRRGALCQYKHPEPYISTSPSASPAPPPAALSPPPQQHPPVAHSDAVPRGAVPYNGMFYFNMPQTQPPPPPQPAALPPAMSLSPVQLVQSPVVFTNPWHWPLSYSPPIMGYPHPHHVAYAPPTWPSLSPVEAPAYPGPTMLPQMPGPAPPTFSPPLQPFSFPPPPQAMESLPQTDLARPTPLVTRSFSAAPDGDFPYVAPREQRVGHARRVSVTIKSREDLAGLGLDSTVSAHERLPWQTHGDRGERRSWAPPSSVLRVPRQAAASPPLM